MRHWTGGEVVRRGDVVAVFNLERRGRKFLFEDVALREESELPVRTGRAGVTFADRLRVLVRVGTADREVLPVLAELKALGRFVALGGVREEIRVADIRGDRRERRTSIERARARLLLVHVVVEDIFLRLRPQHFDGSSEAAPQLAVISESRAKDAREFEIRIGECDVLHGAGAEITRLRRSVRIEGRNCAA